MKIQTPQESLEIVLHKLMVFLKNWLLKNGSYERKWSGFLNQKLKANLLMVTTKSVGETFQ